MNNSPKNTTRIAFIISVLTLTLTLLGMPGHTARLKPIKEGARNSTSTDSTSKQLLTASNRVVNAISGASDRGMDNTSGGRTFYWAALPGGRTWSDERNWCLEGNFNNFNQCIEGPGERPETGVPGAGDKAVVDDHSQQFAREIHLDGDKELDSFTMLYPRAMLRSSETISNTLRITRELTWSNADIFDGAKIVAGENCVVTITGETNLGRQNDDATSLTIYGAGSINGQFKIAESGALKVESTGTLNIESASAVVAAGDDNPATVDILGTVNINGTGGIDVRTLGAINVSGTLNLGTDAPLSSNCECVMSVGAGGKLVKSAGSGTSSIGLKVENAGTVSAESGTLAFSRSFSQSGGATILNGGDLSLTQSPFNLNGGVLAGKGTVTGKVINASVVQPGYPQRTAGQLTIAGDYQQESGGKLEIDIGNTVERWYDRLIVNGATLSGTLDVILINDFHPTCNDSFDIVNYVSRQGQFAVNSGIDLGNGRNFALDYRSDALKLVAQGFENQDTDNDGVFECADSDDDGDGINDTVDNCPLIRNAPQLDFEADGIGDECDLDDDNDNVLDTADNCLLNANPDQANIEGDAQGDACDLDDDNDGFDDTSDNCPLIANAHQVNTDGDVFGDACDEDDDSDGFVDTSDNCPLIANADQVNTDGDVGGNACDEDDDNDSVNDPLDNCPLDATPHQEDGDGDGIGNPCDPNQNDGPLGDLDADGAPNNADNCALIPNGDQTNTDGDGEGNVCDSDDDNDGIADSKDNCPVNVNPDLANNDRDAQGDVCDLDDDNDGDVDISDNCPLKANANQLNHDGDAFGDACDADDDNDGGADITDCAPFNPTIHQFASEVCNGLDDDCDGAVDEGVLITFYRDADGDGYGTETVIQQRCTQPQNYVVNNGDCNDSNNLVHPGATEVCDRLDNDCDSSINEGFTDTDADGQADCTDTDDDNDGLVDTGDNCPLATNPNQADSNGDSIGDVCTVEIVFHSYRDGNAEIYGMKADGTGVVRLTDNVANDYDPVISADRTKIAFVSDRDGNLEIYLMNVNGTNVTRLTTNAAVDRQPAWSPDGSMLVFTSLRDGKDEIYSMDATGERQRNLTNNIGVDCEPDWGSNGKIAFVSTRHGNREIYSMDIDGSNVRRLTNNDVEDSHPSWAPPPNHNQIVFTSFRDGNSEIYVMKGSGSGVQRQTTNTAIDTSPAWGANGEIAFVSDRNGNFEIYSMIRNRRNRPTRLTNQRATDHGPDW